MSAVTKRKSTRSTAASLPITVTLTADILSAEELRILSREAKARKIPLDVVIAKGAVAYARNLASRTSLTERAHEKNDRVFARAFETLTKSGETPTAYRLSRDTGKDFRAALKWLEASGKGASLPMPPPSSSTAAGVAFVSAGSKKRR